MKTEAAQRARVQGSDTTKDDWKTDVGYPKKLK